MMMQLLRIASLPMSLQPLYPDPHVLLPRAQFEPVSRLLFHGALSTHRIHRHSVLPLHKRHVIAASAGCPCHYPIAMADMNIRVINPAQYPEIVQGLLQANASAWLSGCSQDHHPPSPLPDFLLLASTPSTRP